MSETRIEEAFGKIDPSAGKKEFPAGEVVPITEEDIQKARERYRSYVERTKAVTIARGSAALTLSNLRNPAWS